MIALWSLKLARGLLVILLLACRTSLAEDIDRFGIPDTGMILQKQGYVLSYDGRIRGPRWTLAVLTRQSLQKHVDRINMSFKEDVHVPVECRAKSRDYAGSGFDIGHLEPFANHATSESAALDTFLFSNACPQLPDFNRGRWKQLEDAVRSLLTERDVQAVWVLAGPLWICDGDRLSVRFVGRSKIPVASHFFKSVIILYSDGHIEPRSWLIPHVSDPGDLDQWRASIDAIEDPAGCDLWPKLDESLETVK